MRKPTVRTDVKKSEIPLSNVNEQDCLTVVRMSGHASEDETALTIENYARTEKRKQRRDLIKPPEYLKASDKDAWNANILQEGERILEIGDAPRELGEIAPKMLKERQEDAESAGKEIPPVQEEQEATARQMQELEQRAEFYFSKYGHPAQLRRDRWFWRVVVAALWLLEAGLTLGACASYFGITEGPLRYVSLREWLEVVSFGAPAVVTLFALAKFVGWLLKRVTVGMRTIKKVAIISIIVAVFFAMSIGLLRIVANTANENLSDFLVQLGNNALGAISIIGVLVVAICAVAADRQVAVLSKELKSLEEAERSFRTQAARLKRIWTGLTERLGRLRKTARLPDELRTAFESGVQVAIHRNKEDEEEIANRVSAARAAYREWTSKSAIEQEFIMDDLFVLKDENQCKTRGSDEGLNRGNNGGSGRPLITGLILFACLGLTHLPGCGCGQLPAPEAQFIVCDNTGDAPLNTCSTEFLQRAGAGWSEQWKIERAHAL